MSFFQPESALYILSLSGGILLINIILFIILILFGARIFFAISTPQKKALKIKQEAQEKAEKILAEANQEALDTVKRGTMKARELINKAALISENSNKMLTIELESVSEQGLKDIQSASLKFIETYEKMAAGAQNEYLGALHNASQVMAEDAKKSLDMLEKYLKDQTVGYQESMEEKLEDLRNQAQAYINEYRERKLAKIDGIIHDVILLTAKNVLGHSINMEEHNSLIVQALEEAKREGFFSEFHPGTGTTAASLESDTKL